jgi:hypothetical protein
MKLAATAWRAYSSPNPTDIEKVLQTDTSSLPFLQMALEAHLKRFPSVKNGLGRIENRALELMHDGRSSFVELFRKFGDAESVYGLGDAQFWLALQRMSAAREPLLTIEGLQTEPQQALSPGVVQKAAVETTEIGESVLKGEADFVALNGINLWLGGAHLDTAERLWRWDEESGTLVTDNR